MSEDQQTVGKFTLGEIYLNVGCHGNKEYTVIVYFMGNCMNCSI